MASQRKIPFFDDKLASSGLDRDDAKELGMKYLSPSETDAKLSRYNGCPSLYIPYFHPLTNEPMRFVPGCELFFRVRFLGESLPKNKKGKQRRYSQGAKGVCAYFPRTEDWMQIFPDTFTDVFITEGELKAAKACKEGLPTIGLGGVDSFQSSKYFIELLPELGEINWMERHVYIIFDSDAIHNDSIVKAVNRLAKCLANRGAIPFVAFLPDVPRLAKTGLDDYLVHYPVERFRSEVMPTATHLTAAEKIWEMNGRYIVINNPPCVYDKLTHQRLDFAAFIKLNSVKVPAFHKLSVSPIYGKPRLAAERVQLGTEWLQSPARMQADELVSIPEEELLLTVVRPDGVKVRQYNGWRGWGCSPIQGDVEPFHKLLIF